MLLMFFFSVPPEFIVPLSEVTCETGETIVLRCKVCGRPKASVTWKGPDHNTLSNDGHHSISYRYSILCSTFPCLKRQNDCQWPQWLICFARFGVLLLIMSSAFSSQHWVSENKGVTFQCCDMLHCQFFISDSSLYHFGGRWLLLEWPHYNILQRKTCFLLKWQCYRLHNWSMETNVFVCF